MRREQHHIELRADAESVDQFRVNLSEVTSLTALDDLNGFVRTEKAVHGAGSWLLQILVVLQVLGGFLLPVLTQII